MNTKYKFLVLLALVAFSFGSAKAWTFTWTGNANDDWSNASNWSRSGSGSGNPVIPGSSDLAVVNSSAVSGQVKLTSSQTIGSLDYSSGNFNLNNMLLTINGNASFTGGVLSSGDITAAGFGTMQGTSFIGPVVLTKTGNIDDIDAGGNTFTGPVAFINSSAGLWRLASSLPDTHLGGMYYEETGTGRLQPCYAGNNTFTGDIYCASPNIEFGKGTGVVILNSDLTIHGTPYITKMKVDLTGSVYLASDLNCSEFRIVSGQFWLLGRDITVNTAYFTGGSINGDGSVSITDLMAMENTSFTRTVVLEKTGGADNIVNGGNSFASDISIINSSSSLLRLANVAGDIYNGTIYFQENGSGQLEPAYNQTNTFASDINTEFSSSVITFGAGNGSVKIVGNTFQNLESNPSIVPVLNRLVMATNGTFNLNNSSLVIGKSVTFQQGIIRTNSNLLIVNDDATVSGAGDGGHVMGWVRKIGNDAFEFPTGDGVVYAPVSISAPSNVNDHFTARYTQSAYQNLFVTTGLDHVSDQEFWDLNRTGGISNVKVTLSYASAERSGTVDDMAKLRVSHFNSSLDMWESTSSANTTGDVYHGTVTTANPVTNFSPFTLGSIGTPNPLPITLINFTAMPVQTTVSVKWTTANEKNNDYFIVEKSLDGQKWMKIGRVEGATNTDFTLDYQMVDNSPVEGVQFYRLKQIDLDGRYSYSPIAAVRFSGTPATGAVIYPQPAGNVLNVAVQSNEGQDASVTLFDITGVKVIEMNGLGGSLFQLDMSALSTGVYYLEMNIDGVTTKSKILKQ